MRLSTKLLVTFVPLFIIAIIGSYELTIQASEEQMLEQAKDAAFQKAHIVREALVSQMVDKYKVEDSFLNKIRTAGGLLDLYIRIRPDNLHLLEDLDDDTTRATRLNARMREAMSKGSIGEEVFSTGTAMYVRREEDFEAIIPFKAERKCQACHEVEVGHILGVAHVKLPLTEINQSIRANSNRTAIISLGFAAVSLGVGFIFYRSLIQKPVRNLVTATEELRKGNLNYDVGMKKSSDELGILAESFDRMRKALKQSQDALRTSTVGQIAQSLIRDFRAPIREILSSVDQLQRSGSDDQRKQAFETTKNSVQTMQKITQDLLEFTTGDLKANKMSARVPQVIGYVEQMVRPDLEREGIRLQVQQGYTGSAQLDYDRVTRALMNIINYSINYVPPDGEITLSTANENGKLVITIADNGSGIPAAFLDKVFEPFVKIVQERGVGLNLALAKRTIDMQGGKIEVQSTEGKGTTFIITMPIQ
ncbi:MAG: HAMP domain-containing histidine kinase [Ignavibacteriae bacterium]|nr:HAMP domain-containing histidine kinase [Ignavibacteriota bacterium]